MNPWSIWAAPELIGFSNEDRKLLLHGAIVTLRRRRFLGALPVIALVAGAFIGLFLPAFVEVNAPKFSEAWFQTRIARAVVFPPVFALLFAAAAYPVYVRALRMELRNKFQQAAVTGESVD